MIHKALGIGLVYCPISVQLELARREAIEGSFSSNIYIVYLK
jgi:hypothetical protein